MIDEIGSVCAGDEKLLSKLQALRCEVVGAWGASRLPTVSGNNTHELMQRRVSNNKRREGNHESTTIKQQLAANS